MSTAWIAICLTALGIIGIPALCLAVRTAVRMALLERNQTGAEKEANERFERLEKSVEKETGRNDRQDEQINKFSQFLERIDERTASIVKWLEHVAAMPPKP